MRFPSYRQIKGFKFVGYLIVIVDTHLVSKTFSESVQSDKALVIDLPAFITNILNSLELLKQSGLGSEGLKRLSSLKAGKLVMAQSGLDPERTLEVTDDDGQKETVGETSLSGKSNPEARLRGFQRKFAGNLLDSMKERFATLDMQLYEDLRTICDFRIMPLEKTAKGHAELLKWSDEAITRVVSAYFPEIDVQEAKNQALSARLFVRDHQESFVHFKDPSDPSKGKIMRLTGRVGSVYGRLFERSDVCSRAIPEFLFIADYMISFMFQSCCGERAGSVINMVKSQARTGLADETTVDLCFNTCNMPHWHEIDYDLFVDAWKAGGHLMGVTETEGRKVITRHLAKTSDTFLFKKAEAAAEESD